MLRTCDQEQKCIFIKKNGMRERSAELIDVRNFDADKQKKRNPEFICKHAERECGMGIQKLSEIRNAEQN